MSVNPLAESRLAAPLAVAEPVADLPLLVMEAPRGWIAIDWAEIWRYRELLYFLTWRDVKVRYKQTALGAAWAILQPFLTMVVFSLFFGKLAGLGSKTGGVPYPIHVFAALIPWTFFSRSVGTSSNSLISSSNLITKVYFPRLVIPIAAVGAGLVNFGVSFVVLAGMMVYYGVALSWQLALLPVFLVAMTLAACGVGTLLSALTVSYRDFRYVVPFLLQIWMYVTPVIYPSSLVPDQWRWALALNPMSGLIEGFRASILGRPPEWTFIGISVAVSCLLFVGSALYFRKVEDRFADII